MGQIEDQSITDGNRPLTDLIDELGFDADELRDEGRASQYEES